VGFALMQQRSRLNVKVAARKLKDIGARCARLWNYDRNYLQALLEAGIKDVLVAVPPGEVSSLYSGGSNGKAKQIAQVLKPFHNKGMRLRVAVGNEPFLGSSDARQLPQAMENMYSALKQELGTTRVKVTVPFFNGIVHGSYPPENGRFASKWVDTIKKVAAFIHRTKSEFTINIYPFFTRKDNPSQISRDLALGKKQNKINGRTYSGLLHQQLAGARAALRRLDSRYAAIPLTVGESGWPSAGHGEATVANARDYTRHVIRVAKSKSLPLDKNLGTVYLFEGFDEQRKSSSRQYENNFGIMKESGQLKYTVSLR